MTLAGIAYLCEIRTATFTGHLVTLNPRQSFGITGKLLRERTPPHACIRPECPEYLVQITVIDFATGKEVRFEALRTGGDLFALHSDRIQFRAETLQSGSAAQEHVSRFFRSPAAVLRSPSVTVVAGPMTVRMEEGPDGAGTAAIASIVPASTADGSTPSVAATGPVGFTDDDLLRDDDLPGSESCASPHHSSCSPLRSP